MFKALRALCFLTAVAVLCALVFRALAAAVPIDCSSVGAELAAAWLHPNRLDLAAVLCRHDPLPGWWDSLWIVETASGDAPRIVELPLHGTGVAGFSWLDCPGPALAHVVDRTHMGTINDRVFRVGSGGRLQVVDSMRLPPGSGGARPHVPCPSSD